MPASTDSATVASQFRESVERSEEERLSPLAVKSYSAVRRVAEEPCALRTPFQRDRDRIVHSKSFRRLKHKTQVFIAPEGDHYRTRLTHTLEAAGISRTVARSLRLNEDLTEAIGLGHDLGHPPFGHIGEECLDSCLKERFGLRFRHNQHSLRVVDSIERDGQGLNLTEPVRDGILHHTGKEEPATFEGKIVRVVDRVAYINHDIDDALRAGVIDTEDLPQEEISILGDSGSKRIDTLVHDLVENSSAAGGIVQGEQIGKAMASLRTFMFKNVYLNDAAQAEKPKVERVITYLFNYYCENPELLPEQEAAKSLAGQVTDYIAGMTDRFAIRAYGELTLPQEFRY